ncbi:hypothetical protein [Umezawaea beigongshangensis]|uniref:hypothetical protein n=1 Tax=Umezawaea beigongshangensis TaxID=2780383 RepID=UPI0018F1CB0F|nr:hypothetical protein [Umezawaea beigongshangensis]
MRLLVWAVVVTSLAVTGSEVLPLLAGCLLIGCAEGHHFAARHRRPRTGGFVHRPFHAG